MDNFPDERITRGCVADLESPQKDNCTANDNTCKTCIGDGCNEKSAFAECIASKEPMPINYKPKYPLDENIFQKICKNYNDKCFIFVNNEKKVSRDCLNEYLQKTSVSPSFLSENFDATSYEVCSDPLCNDQVIRQIKCFSCDSRNDKDCINTTLIKKKECMIEVNPSGCYHFEGEHIERGCITDLKGEIRNKCESNSDTCKKCNENKCNSKPHFQRCITTDRKNTANSGSKICKNYNDKCFIHTTSTTIRRGCMNDLIEFPIDSINIETDCKNPSICETCSGSINCNHREVIPEKCMVCSSEDNVDCTYYPNANLSQACPLTLKPEGCYLEKTVRYKAKRGCMNNLNDTKRRECQRSDEKCKKCTGDNCNQKPYFQTCAACDSRIDGEKCITQPYLTQSVTCPDYYGDCYTTVQYGSVVRNCVGDMNIPDADACKKNSYACKLCTGKSNCNEDNLKQISCISCDSTVNPSCATNRTFYEFETCPLSVHPQSCYHSIDTLGVHKRGELSLHSKSEKFVFSRRRKF